MLELLIVIGFLAALIVPTLLSPYYYRRGLLVVNGNSYAYEIGDDLYRYGKKYRFSGMALTLPMRLPHIYLDAHNNERLSEQQFLIDQTNRISLEGDFDKYFQAYSKPKYHRMTLEILTPDLMSTLAHAELQFDIEIIGSKLRIITARKLATDELIQRQIATVAERVMLEIDHKLKSWSEDNLGQAEEFVLDLKDEGVYKIRGVNISLRKFAVFTVPAVIWGFVFINAFLLSRSDNYLESEDGVFMMGMSIVMFIISILVVRYISSDQNT